MALKAILDTLDDIDEAHKAFYKEHEAGGKKFFVLDVDGLTEHPVVTNLKTAHEKTKTDKKDLLTKLEAAEARLEGLPEDFNAEQYTALKAQAEGKDPVKADEQVAKVRGDLERKHSAELAKKDERITKLTNKLNSTLIDDRLTAALAEHNVATEFLPAAKALIVSKGAIKVTEEDDDFEAKVETDMGPMEISNFIKDWTNSGEGKVFVKAPTGGGGTGGDKKLLGAENPFDTQGGKVKVNLTKAQEMINTNPEKARQLATAAGYPVTW